MAKLRMPKVSLLVLAVFLVLALTLSTPNWKGSKGGSQTMVLAMPEFLTHEVGSANPIADRLDQEAGISAWFKSTDPINLTNAATAFRVIETQNSDYIIGSVPVTGYPENFDAHVYVHKDGWILAYYLKQDAVSKILDMRAPTINSTNLQAVISTVAGASGVPLGSVNHYDFRYPNATHILMVYEDNVNGSDFTIKLPGTYGYYERGFGLLNTYGGAFFAVDGTNQTLTYVNGFGYGSIAASNLLTDVTHTITVDDFGVLLIVYREQ